MSVAIKSRGNPREMALAFHPLELFCRKCDVQTPDVVRELGEFPQVSAGAGSGIILWELLLKKMPFIDGTTVSMPDTSANQEAWPSTKPGSGLRISFAKTRGRLVPA